MNRAKLKVLVMALKEIVEELESEIYSDTEAYTAPIEGTIADYDEVFDDDDGYPD
jgi:hypothetical protein